ncbi:RT0821/Lpp0805 family surface protein [Labrenzia sp. R4_1]|uniref:RT0821/Lpp0805 family surface protein n=1 Tax=Labrenzia sp. R4_1 TaxID=2821106 RepID=UPI00336A36AC
MDIRAARILPVLTLVTAISGCTASALVGPGTGSGLARSDQTMAEATFQNALEKSLSGKTSSWRNQETGASGSVTPVRTWKTRSGVYCRAYRENILLASGTRRQDNGTACRNKSGKWLLA